MEPSCLPGGGTPLGATSVYGQSGIVGVILQDGYSVCPLKGKLVSLRECLRKQREKPSLLPFSTAHGIMLIFNKMTLCTAWNTGWKQCHVQTN